MVTFEDLLARDFDWALQEADRYFSGKGLVRRTLRELAGRFDDLQVDYAVIGAVAMFYHGFRRFTEDVDILVAPAGLVAIEEHLIGKAFTRPKNWRRGVRDVDTGVAVHVIVAGEPIECGELGTYTISEPQSCCVPIDGLNVLALNKLLELKFALGMSPGHLRHHADAQQLIRYADLPLSYAENLTHNFHRLFAEYWGYAQISKADDY